MAEKVVTGKVRFSYAHVFEPQTGPEGGKPKYSISLVIPKEDKATVSKIKKAIDRVKQEAISSKWGGKLPGKWWNPLRDGDDERPDDSVYENSYFVNAKSDRQPKIVDRNLNEIIDPEDFYSGCYGRASIVFYAFSADMNKGIGVGLNNLQKLEDGESLMGGSNPEDDFGDDSFDDDEI